MILDSQDLEIIREIAALRAELRAEVPRTANLAQWSSKQEHARRRLTVLERQFVSRALEGAISFDGVADYGADFPLLHFTDHAPGSPAHGASFSVGATDALTMGTISELRDAKRREFAGKQKGAKP